MGGVRDHAKRAPRTVERAPREEAPHWPDDGPGGFRRHPEEKPAGSLTNLVSSWFDWYVFGLGVFGLT